MLQKLRWALKREMGVTKRDGAGYCMWALWDNTSYRAGQFPLGCSGKLRCGARVQRTLPDCTDDSTELQNHLYGRVIQGWFMTTGRRGLSRERRRAALFSETTSEKMSWIQTELWPPCVAITLWSVETGSCIACLSEGGLKYFRNYRAAHGSYTNNFMLESLGQGLSASLTCSFFSSHSMSLVVEGQRPRIWVTKAGESGKREPNLMERALYMHICVQAASCTLFHLHSYGGAARIQPSIKGICFWSENQHLVANSTQ